MSFNRAIKTIVSLLLVCTAIGLPATAQENHSFEDSIRAEIQAFLEKGRQLQGRGKMNKDQLDSAFVLLDSAASLSERELGKYDSLHAWSLNWLSFNFAYANDLMKALSCAKAMSEIVDSAFGNDLKLNVYSLALLGDIYCGLGEYSRAINLYNREVDLLNRQDSPLSDVEVFWLILAINDLARTGAHSGEPHEKVLQTYFRAREMAERELGKDHWLYASIIGNMGMYYGIMRDYANAEKYMAESVVLKKKSYGPQSPSVVFSLVKLADYSRLKGDFRTADSLLNQASEIIDSTLGDSHPQLWLYLSSRVALLAAQDSLTQALTKAQQLVDFSAQESDFPTHKQATAMTVLGKIAAAAKNYDLLAQVIKELSSHRQSYLINVFGYASESQKLGFVKQHPPIESHLLAGVIQSPNPVTDGAGINMVLAGKGLAVDAMAAQQTAAICTSDPLLDSLLLEHENICEHIASLAFSSKGKEADEMLEQLFSRKNELETDISMQCANIEFFDSEDSVSYSAVISALPQKSALLEYVQYEDYDYGHLFMNLEYDSSYAAIVLTSSGEKSIIGLGGATTVDSLIKEYHTTMSSALREQLVDGDLESTKRLNSISKELYSILVAPFENYLNEAENVYVAADGAINLLPFETLTKNGNKYLIEDYKFVYLTSGRDLLKERHDLSGREALVLADPDYMIDPSMLPALASTESSPLPAYRGNSATPECLGSMFSPLPMTRQEGKSIAELLMQTDRYDVTYLETDQAREGALKNLNQPPAVLHIATHGYFCEQAENPYLSNPLLRSGLILAGANRTIGDMNRSSISGEDGILTAMEVSGLNLIGTDLVVLSACQTGIGDVQNGEGVFGLRRAFQHAGAKSVIMSMFSVPDESTSDIMERFYENWLSGGSKSSALRDASLSILNERRNAHQSTHPLFWGGFILVGDPE